MIKMPIGQLVFLSGMALLLIPFIVHTFSRRKESAEDECGCLWILGAVLLVIGGYLWIGGI